MKLYKSNYKDKWFVLQDEITAEDEANCGWSVGEITKEEAMEPGFVEVHQEKCEYYGIPCYIGKDGMLNQIYD